MNNKKKNSYYYSENLREVLLLIFTWCWVFPMKQTCCFSQNAVRSLAAVLKKNIGIDQDLNTAPLQYNKRKIHH